MQVLASIGPVHAQVALGPDFRHEASLASSVCLDKFPEFLNGFFLASELCSDGYPSILDGFSLASDLCSDGSQFFDGLSWASALCSDGVPPMLLRSRLVLRSCLALLSLLLLSIRFRGTQGLLQRKSTTHRSALA